MQRHSFTFVGQSRLTCGFIWLVGWSFGRLVSRSFDASVPSSSPGPGCCVSLHSLFRACAPKPENSIEFGFHVIVSPLSLY
jgi:hypothetical protein